MGATLRDAQSAVGVCLTLFAYKNEDGRHTLHGDAWRLWSVDAVQLLRFIANRSVGRRSSVRVRASGSPELRGAARGGGIGGSSSGGCSVRLVYRGAECGRCGHPACVQASAEHRPEVCYPPHRHPAPGKVVRARRRRSAKSAPKASSTARSPGEPALADSGPDGPDGWLGCPVRPLPSPKEAERRK